MLDYSATVRGKIDIQIKKNHIIDTKKYMVYDYEYIDSIGGWF
jgi:hypothetical protein